MSHESEMDARDEIRQLRAKLDALGSLDGIRTAALALPVEDRNALRMALTASLPIPRCFDTSPAIMAKVAQTMTAAPRRPRTGECEHEQVASSVASTAAERSESRLAVVLQEDAGRRGPTRDPRSERRGARGR